MTWCLVSLLLCNACKKAVPPKAALSSPSPVEMRETASPQPKVEACSLISKEEVGAIQKAAITDAKSSSGPSGNLVMSQCYYSAKEPNMAVSVALIQPSAGSATGTEARAYWENTVRRSSEHTPGEASERANEKRGEREEENKNPPKKIDGVGEEAYWSGNQFGGALYVLSRNIILRISVGGPDNEDIKIEKSKALAEKAIGRL